MHQLINQDTFWQIIETARESNNGKINGMHYTLLAQLQQLPAESIQQFHNIYKQYHSAAYKSAIWAAGHIMNAGYCSDDGFIDFRAWLIANGKDVYYNTMKEPDSLADIEAESVEGFYDYEFFGYAAQDAYNKVTNGKALAVDQKKTIEDIPCSRNLILPFTFNDFYDYFPELCHKYNYDVKSEQIFLTTAFHVEWMQTEATGRQKLDWLKKYLKTTTECEMRAENGQLYFEGDGPLKIDLKIHKQPDNINKIEIALSKPGTVQNELSEYLYWGDDILTLLNCSMDLTVSDEDLDAYCNELKDTQAFHHTQQMS